MQNIKQNVVRTMKAPSQIFSNFPTMSKPHLGSKHSVVGSTSQIWDCGSLNLCKSVSTNPAVSLWQAKAKASHLAKTTGYWEKQNVVILLPSLAHLNCQKSGVSVCYLLTGEFQVWQKVWQKDMRPQLLLWVERFFWKLIVITVFSHIE